MRATLLALLLITAAGLFVAPASAAAQPPSAAQEGFVPVDQLPTQEQIPAARFVIAAYAVAWTVIFGYVWSIGRRLDGVEREIAQVSRRVAGGTRS